MQHAGGADRGAEDAWDQPGQAAERHLATPEAGVRSPTLDRRRARGTRRGDDAILARLHAAGERLFALRHDEPALLDTLVGELLWALEAPMGTARLHDPGTGALPVIAARGIRDRAALPMGASAVAFDEGRPAIVEDTEADPLYESHVERSRALGYRAVVALPLVADAGQPLGVVTVLYADPGTPDERALRAALLLVRQVALSLENARLVAAAARARAADSAAVAERARLEQREHAARRAADAASAAKSEFLAVMSHELRTPLNAIGGYAELLELGIRGALTPEQVEDVRRIRRSQRQLLGLISDVLDFARLDARQVEFRVTDVPVADALETCRTIVAAQYEAAAVRLDVASVEPALQVRADAARLQQIVLSLLSNAAKFTPAGGRVTLEAQRTDDGARLSISVGDTGIGIPVDRLELIFEPFVLVDGSHRRTRHGVGLGLAISRELARGMGGDLTVTSEEGVGSTFVLVLPAA